jgi:glucans biosynthesis protein C
MRKHEEENMKAALLEKTSVSGAKPRLAFVDNIRWTVIAMVVLVHACCTYSGLGSWYYHEKASLDVAAKLVFYVYEIFSQAFFMGLLFFVAAAFTPGAYDRKGFGRFVLDRFVRLGIPSLVYMLILHPVTVFINEAGTGHGKGLSEMAGWYGRFVASGTFLRESGPLWFAVALLAFSLVYAVIRRGMETVRTRRLAVRAPSVVTNRAVHGAAILLIVVIALGSFFIRLVQPVGTNWMNMQLCFFPQYVVLFAVGIWAGRKGLLSSLPRQAGRVWLWLAFAIGVPGWFLLMGLGGALSGNEVAYAGGWTAQAAGYAVWEAFFCVAISIGLVTLYRERANARTRVSGLLSDTSFGIYVFHAPILVGASVLLQAVVIYPLAKALIVAAAAWAVSLGVAWLVRKIPGIGRLFA